MNKLESFVCKMNMFSSLQFNITGYKDRIFECTHANLNVIVLNGTSFFIIDNVFMLFYIFLFIS